MFEQPEPWGLRVTGSVESDLWLSPRVFGHTFVVGLIGWPVEHSVSPPMQNAAFRALGLDWCYVALPVQPARVKEALAGVWALGLRGINVTVPHKQAVVSLVDELTPAARVIGAVNTVLVREDRLIGHNTDAGGFLRAVRETGLAVEGCSALVLGAGGAARAVVYALASVSAQVTILNRSLDRARSLAHDLGAIDPGARLSAGPLDAAALQREAPRADLIVQTTPLGMWPHIESTPWVEEVPYPSGALLFDLVYNPRETRLMQWARRAGAKASHGLGMLVHQGAEAFKMWTGQEPPIEVMYAACNRVLGG